MTSVAGETPWQLPRGERSATFLMKPTTSALSSKDSQGFLRMQSSPTFTPGTTARMMVPTTCSTRPRMSTVVVVWTACCRSGPMYSKAMPYC